MRITFLVNLFLTYLINGTFSAEIKTRRIINGHEPKSPRPFMAYLLKTDKAKVKYDAWMCGGAIVHPSFILTSAACIEDVQFMYAVVGYDKYVNSKDIKEDECIKKFKKKIVKTCVPKLYEFSYENVTQWGTTDIAVAKTESPIDFSDNSYKVTCSYTPQKIDINYDMKYQAPGTDGIIFGWGHTDKFRKEEDTIDYNQQKILEASVLIVHRKVCMKYWPKHWHATIDKYMICSNGVGNLDGDGSIISKPPELKQGCSTDGRSGPQCLRQRNNKSHTRTDTDKDTTEKTDKDTTDKTNKDTTEKTDKDTTEKTEKNKSPPPDEDSVIKTKPDSEGRFGFCQNDHGGPLISWVGSKPKVLGIQSVFLLNTDFQCSGPFLYSSTSCNGAFLDCILNDGRRSGTDCNASPAEKGFDISERSLSWLDHPDGPADSEMRQPMPADNELKRRPMRDDNELIRRPMLDIG